LIADIAQAALDILKPILSLFGYRADLLRWNQVKASVMFSYWLHFRDRLLAYYITNAFPSIVEVLSALLLTRMEIFRCTMLFTIRRVEPDGLVRD
jgi:hypothetical protein